MTQKIKVLVVDDSLLIRKILTRLINAQSDMEVIAEAVDPIEARTHLVKNPDVLTLDVEMPRMDGLTFLQKLMKLRPLPVVMVSTLTEKSAAITFKALELGAFDFVTKPRLMPGSSELANGEEILSKIRAAYKARDYYRKMAPPPEPIKPAYHSIHVFAGTGANGAYKELLGQLHSDSPPLTIVHKMPEGFAAPFVSRLQQQCPVPVVLADKDIVLQPGHVYVIPSETHPQIKMSRILELSIAKTPVQMNTWASSIGSICHQFATIVVLSGADSVDVSGFKLAYTQGTAIYGESPELCAEPTLVNLLNEIKYLKSFASPASLGESLGLLNAKI